MQIVSSLWLKNCVVDFIFDPYIIMGRQMLGTPTRLLTDLTEQEKYVVNIYRSRKNVIPYKEDLIDCFASKLKRYSNKLSLIHI